MVKLILESRQKEQLVRVPKTTRLTHNAEDVEEKPSTDNTRLVELVDTPELKPEDFLVDFSNFSKKDKDKNGNPTYKYDSSFFGKDKLFFGKTFSRQVRNSSNKKNYTTHFFPFVLYSDGRMKKLELDRDEHKAYRKLVGQLLWLLPIRPDIGYAVKNFPGAFLGQLLSTCLRRNTC